MALAVANESLILFHLLARGPRLQMRFIDFLTLILIIAAGLQLGLQGYFHWDMTRALFGGYKVHADGVQRRLANCTATRLGWPNVRFTPIADIDCRPRNVRYVP